MYVQSSNADSATAAASRSNASSRETSAAASVDANALAARETDPNTLRTAVAAINRAAKSLTNTVQLVMDERSAQPVVRVVDSDTGDLIRQIPTEEVLELRRALDRISGLLINRTA